MNLDEALLAYKAELDEFEPGRDSSLPVDLAVMHIGEALLEEWGLPTPQGKFRLAELFIDAQRVVSLEEIQAVYDERCAQVAVDEAAEDAMIEPASRPYRKRPIPEDIRWEVFERDGFKCVTCGSRRFLRADHKHPERHGGLATLENLQTLCRSCNSRKGARVPSATKGGA
jgi:hypothetical protein